MVGKVLGKELRSARILNYGAAHVFDCKLQRLRTAYAVSYNKIFLAFRGLCIVIYSYNKSQQDALFLNFILIRTLHVSDRFTVHLQESQHCIHSNRYLSC